jgi:hypothetical protein
MSLLLGDHTLAGLKAAAVEPDLPALLQRALSATMGQRSDEKGQHTQTRHMCAERGVHLATGYSNFCAIVAEGN